MVKVGIIGSGNVAQHLIAAFENSESINVVQVFSRDKSKVAHLIADDKVSDDLMQLTDADLYIIAVSDDAIETVAAQLPFVGKLVAHTSGSMPLDVIGTKNNAAVFYPLQTFTKNKPVNFKEIPICIEAMHQSDYTFLNQVASAISMSVHAIDSQQRKALHVAAVFVSNFTNHLYQVGSEICNENQLSFDILKPLIAETANKIRLLLPDQAQTGPARRGDQKTIAAHLDFLQGDKRKLYEILTQSIINHGQKL
jgi:predicted short-subunit dehydrogenase-like oxidoreductase (DUF2520 family)